MKRLRVFFALTACSAVIGCGGDRVQVESIEVKQDSAVNRAKSLLGNYAKGQALGSEVASFDKLVTDVKAEDPARGEILEKGLAELQKTKGDATKSKAKDLLAKLAPKMTGGS